MRRLIKISLFLSVLIFSQISAQTKYTLSLDLKERKLPFGLSDFVPSNKPVIAFALSGGGARGLSQIGVLKAFEEAGIKPDLVVGTSMGSIIGGLYSAGYSVSQIDSIASKTKWEELLSLNNQTNRKDLFVDQKVTEDRAVFSLRLDGFKPILPTSFSDGQDLSNYLNILAFNAPIHSDTSFDLLPIKFRAVCTDLISGDAVVMENGSLSKALRASSSVTFFLSPIHLDSMLLVDGGLVANIPVEIAKQNGGDFVIAINATSSLWLEKDLDIPWNVADQIVSIPMRLNNSVELSKADFIVEPALGNFVSTDFTKTDSLIMLGYQSAQPLVQNLKIKIDSTVYNSLPENEMFFKHLRFSNNLTLKEKAYFFGYENADSISNKKINYDMYNLFETGDYINLSAEINCFNEYCELNLIKEENPFVNEIDIIGISLISSEKISEILSSIKNQRFARKKLAEKLVELIGLYREDGYALAEIQSLEYNEDERRLTIFVDEGIVSRIEVEGNTKTNKSIITREFGFEEGDFFKINDMKSGLTNLKSTTFFDNIDVVVKEESGQNVIVIRVKERPSSLLRISFRADNEYRTQLGLDLRDENLFGTGTELGLILFGGLDNRAYIIEQKANRIFDTYLTYKLNAYYKFNDVRVYDDVSVEDNNKFSREEIGKYRQRFYGFSVGVGMQAGRFGNLIFEGKYQFDETINREFDPIEPYKIKIVSLKISTTIDTQDKYPYPQKGIYFYGFYETAQSILGGDVGYSNINLDFLNYFSISNSSVVMPKIKFGFADKTLPLSQQYSLGGLDSFFGMHENEYRGRQIFLASLMYRYKLPVKIFFDTYFKFRYDLGSTWPEQEEIKFKNLKHGIGGTLSFDTPIGPADFAVGRSFLFKQNQPGVVSWGDVLFYFSIGYYY